MGKDRHGLSTGGASKAKGKCTMVSTIHLAGQIFENEASDDSVLPTTPIG